MQSERQHTNADEYIRRIDRLVLVTGMITATLAASLIV
jgi:hypothetical protein